MTRLAAHRLRIARDAAIREGRHDLRLIIDQPDQFARLPKLREVITA